MKAITIRQPWAQAVAEAAKTVENRQAGFPRHHRGPVGIHAAAGWSDRGAYDGRLRDLWPEGILFGDALREVSDVRIGRNPGPFTRGAILAVAELVDVHPAAGCCHPWGEDTYTMNGGRRVVDVAHLVFENVRKLVEPVPCRGYLGLWTLPVHVLVRVQPQLDMAQWEADHDPPPDGYAWSGSWLPDGDSLVFEGANLVPAPGFPIERVRPS